MVKLIVVDPHQSCSLKVAVVSMPIPANSTALTDTLRDTDHSTDLRLQNLKYSQQNLELSFEL